MLKDKNKIIIVLVGLICMFLSLIVYLSYFTVFKAQKIIDNPANRRETIDENKILRGSILDSKGNILAYSDGKDGKYQRHYNYPITYSHIIGYSDKIMGKTGIEKSYDKYLLGRESSKALKSLKSFFNPDIQLNIGNNVVLTTNSDIQQKARDLLNETGAAGALVAIRPNTGEILAMVSLPDFNSQSIAQDNKALIEQNRGAQYNRALWTKYPPGSTFKVITAASIIENKLDQNYKDEGTQEIDGRVYTNAGGKDNAYGNVNLKTALVNSINTYFVKKSVDLGSEHLGKSADKFMFNQNFKFDLPFHESIFDYNNISKTDLASSGIGQGNVQATPLEMCMVAAGIANNGNIMKPYLVSQVNTSDGENLLNAEPEVLSSAISEDTANELKEYMLSVVSNGTGSAAYRRGYKIAGKTGTAQKSTEGTENYAWFIGFAPAKNPKIAVAVVLEDVEDHGGKIAAPIAGTLMKYALDLGV